ncbi:hypothetical protein ACJJWD_08410 [Comamonas testosteroni]|uniref:hypothetical protein n=1 Tax=Comamonas testosteroni TaxID=285 RepID=UPI00389A2B80
MSAFHERDAVKGSTFAVVPCPEQKADLEYRTYAKAPASGLTKAGLPETNLSNAKYAVLMNYSIDNSKSEISSIPIIGQTGAASSNTYGQVNRSGSFSATTYNTPTLFCRFWASSCERDTWSATAVAVARSSAVSP